MSSELNDKTILRMKYFIYFIRSRTTHGYASGNARPVVREPWVRVRVSLVLPPVVEPVTTKPRRNMSDAEELQRLSQQVVQLGRSVDSALSAIMDLRLRVASIEGNTAAPGPTRSSGYVNWGASHDVLKTQRWVKLSKIREFIGQMEGLWSFGTGKANLESLPASSNVVAVDEVTRFPQGEAYVNIYSPHVSAELTALKMQSTRPGTGLLQRFNDNYKDDVQTFSSFEEKYQLKWVD